MGEESSNNSRRARFYKLVDEQWIEIGTGNLSLDVGFAIESAERRCNFFLPFIDRKRRKSLL